MLRLKSLTNFYLLRSFQSSNHRHITEKVQFHVLLVMLQISVNSNVGTSETVVDSASGDKWENLEGRC